MGKTELTISSSPHNYSPDTVRKIMYGVIIALIPSLIVSVVAFGLGAIITTLAAVVFCIAIEYLIQKFVLKSKVTISDGSAMLTGLLLAFNLPSNIPIWIVLIGCLVAIGVGKMTFGGIGNNPFNPALVGRVFLLISFPVQMTSWPKPMTNFLSYSDAVTGATPLAIMKEGLKKGDSIQSILDQLPSYSDMFIGFMGGSLGEISAIALLIGFVYMLIKKIITWHIPVTIIGTITIFSGILWLISPDKYADPVFHLLTGGVLLGTIFMATDMVTSPMTFKGMFIFGAGIGILTILIRVFGAYPEGVSFAILIMNGFVPLINRVTKPARFGGLK